MTCIAAERDHPLNAMWHAYRVSSSVAQNADEISASVVHALLNARYYDSSRGQFLSEDLVFLGEPKQQNLTDPQSFNTYSYSVDNPITKKDPDGRFSIGVSYNGNLEGGFGAYSATYGSTNLNLVVDPATRLGRYFFR